jgi:hypothetical protein
MKSQVIAICAALLAASPGAMAWGAGNVAVNAGADSDYLRLKFGEHGARVESYVLAQGNSFFGMTRDPSAEGAQFAEIARTIAPYLAIDHYYPAKDAKSADLIIVIHWGQTFIDHFYKKQAMYDAVSASAGHVSPSGEPGISRPAFTDPGFVSQDVEAAGVGGGNPGDNSRLLGYDSDLKKAQYAALGRPWGASKDSSQVSEDAFGEDIFNDMERYFVILEAFDFNTIKAGKTGVKPKLLWSVHYSITALGYNFTTALPVMSKVASNFFGRQTNGLLFNAGKVPAGRVEVGEPRTVAEPKAN